MDSGIVDIINEYGVKSVSLKTNISIESLTKLSENDYLGFTKIQTLGFVKIIEREYNLDLLERKNDIREYFIKSDNIKQDHFITTDVDSNAEGGGFSRVIFYIFIILVIYGLWYIYENYYKITLIQDIIEPQKTYFNIENNHSKVVKKEPIIAIASVEIKKIIEKNETKEVSKPIVLNILNTLNYETTEANKTTQSDEINNSIIVVKKDKKLEKIIALRTNIEIIPLSKMWFGFINITNPKKIWHKSYKREKSYSFDVNNKSWLMMTNKAKFNIKDGKKNKKYDIKSTTYFKINSENGMQEVSYNEYNSLGGYRVW